MEQRAKKEKRQRFLFNIIIIIFIVVCGGVGGQMVGSICKQYFPEETLDLGNYLFAVSGIFVIVGILIILHSYIHEVGHLIAGLMSGYRFQSIRFGSLMFLKTESGIKIRRYTLAGTGGQCLMLPPENKGDDYPTFLYNMGGCFLNILLSLISIICFFFCEKASIPALILMLSFLVGIGLAIMNGVPLSSLSNDGYNAGSLKRDVEARRAFRTQLFINNCLAKGESVKDMPEDWFAWEEKVTDNNLAASGGVMRFSYLIECQRFEEAKALGGYLLENAMSLADVHEQVIKAELIFCDIILDEKREVIKQKYEQGKKKFEPLKTLPSMQRFLFAYYLIVEKDAKKAEECLKLFDKIAKKYPYPAEMDVERELINLIKEKEKSA